MEKQDIFVIIGQVLFSMFGACAKWLNVKDKRKQKTLVAELSVAAFGGGLVYFVHKWTSMDLYLAFIVAGLFGWLGSIAIDALGRWLVQKTGVDPTILKDKESEVK